MISVPSGTGITREAPPGAKFLLQPYASTNNTNTTTTSTTHQTSTTIGLRSRQSSSRQGTVETASQAGPSTAPETATSAITTNTNPRIPSPSFQPPYPSPSPIEPTSNPGPGPEVRVTSPTRWSLRNALIGGGNPELTFASPFRSRSGTGGSSIARGRPRRPSTARLWNPSNSTPRGPSSAHRRQSPGERVIAVPLQHPDLNSPREGAAAGGEYPLLTLPEQRQKRHSGSTRASLQVERSGSSTGTNRVSLPRSVSIDIARKRSGENSPRLDKGKGKAVDEEREDTLKQLERPATGYRKRGQTVSSTVAQETSGISFDKGKGKTNMSADIERGPDALGSYEAGGTSNLPNNGSHTSFQSGIGAAMSDSTSIIGSDGPPMNPAEEWGPQHPCFPHMNPHVPLSSPLYQTTRIIRIRRDWMIEGDLAPTFSNLYPEILDPAGVSEQEFRTLVERVNNELIPAFSPWNIRNLVDGFLGLLTGWVWDDMGFTAVKSRLNNVERYLEEWNREMEGRGKEGPGSAPRIVPLRRTGYMNLDIQVPDPEISYPASTPGDDRTATGLSHASQ
ncbi:Golgin subfamily A member 7/ERF4 family-domain-containing protein [Rhexocercosporidium sp. MPI-PUGE-AT-0058]|nr:Golgin subfamily A member 7/ERF4 family-domain-containing protein [Rhexocercosporidium sp. MPI-PUGE-AT-0058]